MKKRILSKLIKYSSHFAGIVGRKLISPYTICTILWTTVTVTAIFVVSSIDKPKTDVNKLSNSQKLKTTLLIDKGDGSKFYEFSREKAIEKALDRVAATVNYVMAGAAACLAFIFQAFSTKGISNSAIGSKVNRVLGWNVILACIVSLLFGLFSIQFFPLMATAETFSIYREIGYYAVLQILSLIVGGILSGILVIRLAEMPQIEKPKT